MAWCHYMNQGWPGSPMPYRVSRPQWVNKWDHGIHRNMTSHGMDTLKVFVLNCNWQVWVQEGQTFPSFNQSYPNKLCIISVGINFFDHHSNGNFAFYFQIRCSLNLIEQNLPTHWSFHSPVLRHQYEFFMYFLHCDSYAFMEIVVIHIHSSL